MKKLYIIITAVLLTTTTFAQNVTDPSDVQDTARKAYVDLLQEQIAALNTRILALEPTIGDFRDGGVVFWVDPA
ncbi:MAG: hypothetical protein ABJK28_08415 [Algibacter sp.]